MRGIATTRRTTLPGLDAAVTEALRLFDGFIATWVGSGAHELAYNSPACDRVRDAIIAVGKTAHRDREIGRAVFKVSYTNDNRSRLQFECVSPVFEEPQQHANALKNYRTMRDGHFELLAVVEPL